MVVNTEFVNQILHTFCEDNRSTWPLDVSVISVSVCLRVEREKALGVGRDDELGTEGDSELSCSPHRKIVNSSSFVRHCHLQPHLTTLSTPGTRLAICLASGQIAARVKSVFESLGALPVRVVWRLAVPKRVGV